jgi:hypothetical protein
VQDGRLQREVESLKSQAEISMKERAALKTILESKIKVRPCSIQPLVAAHR